MQNVLQNERECDDYMECILSLSLSFLLPRSEPQAPTLPVLYNCDLATFHEHTHSGDRPSNAVTSIPPSRPSRVPIGSRRPSAHLNSATRMPLTCVARSGYVAKLFLHTFPSSRGRRLCGSLAWDVI